MLQGVIRPKETVTTANDMDLDEFLEDFSQEQKKLAQIYDGQRILAGMNELRLDQNPNHMER